MIREKMNIVVVGHVDHGKSTVIGRLLADTGSLPEGKLEQVKNHCAKNARPFEYAFLLDALKDEQAQGITIDTCRCFFKTNLRDYIIIDAPGHIEFLKNMVTGAARAEAALLVIDAHEGIQENSRRHGYMISMLGIKQLVVLVNKMDLVNYDLKIFEEIKQQYTAFLAEINVVPLEFIPICARDGENIATRASWYQGKTVLEHIDQFQKEADDSKKPFRFPVQDIYKFTAQNDNRRIVAGTVESGSISVGDQVVFYPSQKSSTIKTIELFNAPSRVSISAGAAPGFTLTEELYIKPGELMVKKGEKEPVAGSRFRATVFWMGKAPMIKNKRYKLKIAASRAHVFLSEIISVLDAADLVVDPGKDQINRHDVAECILETTKPIAFDLSSAIAATGRFVIVDNYEIAGGGIIREALEDAGQVLRKHISRREALWEKSSIMPIDRELRYSHKSKFIVITGSDYSSAQSLGRRLEQRLFAENFKAYYLGLSNLDYGLDVDMLDLFEIREERIRRLGELARIMTDSGQIFITALLDADENDLDILQQLNIPNEILVVNLGVSAGSRQTMTLPEHPELADLNAAAIEIEKMLKLEKIIPDYSI